MGAFRTRSPKEGPSFLISGVFTLFIFSKMSGRKFAQIVASAAANFGQMTNGFVCSITSFAIPQLISGEDTVQLTLEESSWFASMSALGAISGALLGGVSCEKLGRRWSMILDCLGYIIGFLLIGFGNNFPLLLFGRILTGHFAASNLVCCPIFVGETSHPSIRGLTGTMLGAMYCTGFSLCMLLGAIFPWRTVAFLSIIPSALSILLLLLIKESPTWLIRNGRDEEAYQSLMFYRGDQVTVREELDKIKDNLRRIEKQIEAEGGSTLDQIKAKFKRMCQSNFMKPFLLLNLMLNIGMEWGGFPALAYYMHTILHEVKVPVDPYWVAVYLAAYRSVICIGLSFVLVKLPRRPIYMFSGSLVAIALLIQAAFAWFGHLIPEELMEYGRWIPPLAIVLSYTGYGLGYGVLVYNFQGEILPSDMRSFGAGLLGIIDNVFLFFAIKLVPVLMSSIGVGGLFFMYCCVVLFTVTTCFFTMPETKGLSLEEIEDYYTYQKHAAERKKAMAKV